MVLQGLGAPVRQHDQHGEPSRANHDGSDGDGEVEAAHERLPCEVGELGAEHADRSGVRLLQQDHFPQQCRFSGAAAADDGEDLLAVHLEVDSVVYDMVAEARRDFADFDDRFALHVRGPAR